MNTRRNWTEDEVAEALALYLRLDFGKFHSRNPEIITLATRLGRTASAVALKLANLAALDDSLPQQGMANASATDRRVWAGFLANPSRVLDAFSRQRHKVIEQTGFSERQARFEARQQDDPTTLATVRVGQDFFREMIVVSYRGRCALTGNDDPRLLTASHIVGWAEDKALRLNPTNGILLNALHDRAFDRHLITFDEDYRMQIASDVPQEARRALERVEDRRLALPGRFLPDQACLERHRRRFAERQHA